MRIPNYRAVAQRPDGLKTLRVGLWAPLPPPLGGVSAWTMRFRDAADRHALAVRLVDIAPRDTGFSERSRFRIDRAGRAASALADLKRVLELPATPEFSIVRPSGTRPDLVHLATTLFWSTPRDAAALALWRRAGLPTVMHIHASTQIVAWREQLAAPGRWLLDRALRQADHVVVLSRELEDYLGRVLPGLPCTRIGNMIAPPPRPGPPILAPRKALRTRILFVGMRTPLKGLAELATAVLRHPELELAVVGDDGGALDPSQGEAMRAALSALRASGQLVESGSVPLHAIGRVYREADVFALPSHREGLPNVLLEAMAAGLPCIATPVGGIPDVAGVVGGADERVRLVPPGDTDALAATLVELATPSAARDQMAARGQAYAQAEHGIDEVMARYRAVYTQLVAATSAREVGQ